MSSAGGGAGNPGVLADLAGGMDRLGMESCMVDRLAPVGFDFARNQGDSTVGKLPRGALEWDLQLCVGGSDESTSPGR